MHELKLGHPWVGLAPAGASQGGGVAASAQTSGRAGVALGTVHITERHRRKLQGLYRATAGEGGYTEAGFDAALFRGLMRYQAIGGASFQAALPPAAFTALAQGYGVAGELFASPFNAHFGSGQHCSALPDTDAAFGSLGSFHSFVEAPGGAAPLEGSFELNPPFVGALYRLPAHRRRRRGLARARPRRGARRCAWSLWSARARARPRGWAAAAATGAATAAATGETAAVTFSGRSGRRLGAGRSCACRTGSTRT